MDCGLWTWTTTSNFLQLCKKVDRDVNNSDCLESIWLYSDSFDVVSFMFWSNAKVNASKVITLKKMGGNEVIHQVSVQGQGVQRELWRTKCGWRFGKSKGKSIGFDTR